MTNSLFDPLGHRKYLVSSERLAFVQTAMLREKDIANFCLSLAITGARISEVLALTRDRIDVDGGTVVLRTLKQRRKVVYRAIPVPKILLTRLYGGGATNAVRIWPWGRTTAWKIVKSVMRDARIADAYCKPKALRHTFAVQAGQRGVPLNIVQRWLGHSRIETTAIYANALGEEERNLARHCWETLNLKSLREFNESDGDLSRMQS